MDLTESHGEFLFNPGLNDIAFTSCFLLSSQFRFRSPIPCGSRAPFIFPQNICALFAVTKPLIQVFANLRKYWKALPMVQKGLGAFYFSRSMNKILTKNVVELHQCMGCISVKINHLKWTVIGNQTLWMCADVYLPIYKRTKGILLTRTSKARFLERLMYSVSREEICSGILNSDEEKMTNIC